MNKEDYIRSAKVGAIARCRGTAIAINVMWLENPNLASSLEFVLYSATVVPVSALLAGLNPLKDYAQEKVMNYISSFFSKSN